MLDDMIDGHHQLRRIAADLRDQLAAIALPSDPRFAASRWAFTREVLKHMAVEAQLLSSTPYCDNEIAAEGAALAAEFGAHYRRHLLRWPLEAMAERWVEYRKELLAILAALDRVMQHEQKILLPHLNAATDHLRPNTH
jgi:hypothetical protein